LGLSVKQFGGLKMVGETVWGFQLDENLAEMNTFDPNVETESYFETSDDSDGVESVAEPPPAALPAAPKQDIKPAATRQVVDAVKLSTLMSIHARFFSEYSKGRKNVTQLIPNKIWPSVIKIFSYLYKILIAK
jgi:hypothetical protein